MNVFDINNFESFLSISKVQIILKSEGIQSITWSIDRRYLMCVIFVYNYNSQLSYAFWR